MRILEGHRGDVRAVCFTPTGQLVSGGSDRRVRLWDLSTGECLHVLKAGDRVYAVAVDPTGEMLAYAGKTPVTGRRNPSVMGRNLVRRWNLRWECAEEDLVWEMESARSIWSLSFSSDGNYLAAAGRERGAGGLSDGGGGYWWRRQPPFQGQPPFQSAFADTSINALAFSPSTSEIALATSWNIVVLEHPEKEGGLDRFRLEAEWASAVLLLPSAAPTAIAAASSFLYIGKRGHKVRRIKTALRTITALATSHDGRAILAAGRPGLVEVYDTEAFELRASYNFDVGAIHAAAYSPDGCTFALGADRGLVLCDLD
jgi:WD40 repeat protein